MDIKYLSLLLIMLISCVGCNFSKSSVRKANDDFTPTGLKKAHKDEWVVIDHVTEEQQRQGGPIFSNIDKYVREYIEKKSIKLSDDKLSQIQEIDAICDSAFDISDYDNSNMGMHIADGTSRMFDLYINWLYQKAADEVKGTGIDMAKEQELVKLVLDAFYDCCDSVAHRFEGSGAWTGVSLIHGMEIEFNKSMCNAILNPQLPTNMPYQLNAEHFKKECDVRMANYKSYSESPISEKDARSVFDKYIRAMKTWFDYRSYTENRISDSVLKLQYSHITRTFARTLYIHLKNNFEDIGMYNDFMYSCFLHDDCSDDEMLEFSFEASYEIQSKKIGIE